jgi:hypothetical protein
MPTFALVYHLKSSDQKPQECIEAESIQHAGQIAQSKFETPGAILCPHDNEMVVVPKESVAVCHIRQMQERRKVTARPTFEDDGEETPAE